MGRIGLKFHWGETELPGYMRFRTGRYRFNGKDKENLNHHPVRRMYGVSFKSHWFVGWMSLGDPSYINQDAESDG